MASDRSPEALASLKDAAARAAAELVQDGMKVGLGTGTTVACLLAALGDRAGELRGARCAATSPQTAQIARELGLNVSALDELGELDIAIDGADQVDPDGWLIKGGGGAHTREKIVAAAARRFVVIVSANKLCVRLQPPVPLEVLRFGVSHTLAALQSARLRTSDAVAAIESGDALESPDGNPLALYDGPIEDPRALAARLSETPGVVAHGLFAPEMVSDIVVASAEGVRWRAGGKRSD
jgi:ribose 5-phosphate isomerase A